MHRYSPKRYTRKLNETDQKDPLVAYEDIEPYQIGRVKVEDVAIVCTSKRLLPWLSKEVKCTMVDTLYCAEVGTIISPTTVVQKHINLYQRFTINVSINNETGELELNHRDGVQHIKYPMILINGLWFHKYAPFNSHQHQYTNSTMHASVTYGMAD